MPKSVQRRGYHEYAKFQRIICCIGFLYWWHEEVKKVMDSGDEYPAARLLVEQL